MSAKRRRFGAWVVAGGVAVAFAGGCTGMPVKEQVRFERMEQAVAPMAATALDAGQIETARRLYNRLLEVNPNSVTARMGLAEVALAVGRRDEAAQWFRQAADRATEPAERRAALLAHGRAALVAGDLKGARTSFAALSESPGQGFYDDAAWGFNGVGVVQLLEGDALGAAAAFETAVRLAPGEQRFRSNLARAQEIVSPLPKAASHLETAPLAEPPQVDARRPETRSAALTVSSDAPTAAAGAAIPVLAEAASAPLAGVSRGRQADAPAATSTGEMAAPDPNDVADGAAQAVDRAADDIDEEEAKGMAEFARAANSGGQEGATISTRAEETVEQEGNETKSDAATPGGPVEEPSGWFVREGDGHYLQVGAFAEEATARRVVVRLDPMTELPVRMEIVDVGGGQLHRVRIGPIPSRSTLPELAAAIGIDAATIRMPWPASETR